jgi:hypothetical protein
MEITALKPVAYGYVIVAGGPSPQPKAAPFGTMETDSCSERYLDQSCPIHSGTLIHYKTTVHVGNVSEV